MTQDRVDQPPESRAGFDDFFRENEASLLLFLMRLGAEPEEAEETFQDAMFQVYRLWDQIDHPRSYVRVVAERTFLRSKTRVVKQRLLELDAFRRGEGDRVDPRSSLSSVIFKEETQRVLALLRTLPPEQRRVMAWHLDGYSPSEIAAQIDKTETTVRSNLRHAKAALRLLFEQQKATRTWTGRRIDDGRGKR